VGWKGKRQNSRYYRGSTSKLTAARYFHTIRYLKPVQIYGRLRYKLYRPKPDLKPAPPIRTVSGTWRIPAKKSPSLIAPDRFRFLNKERNILSSADWNRTEWDKLWLYNLHYFDDLNAIDNDTHHQDWHRSLLNRWLTENPPGTEIGWEPYPLSLRIVNWIKWILADNALPHEAIESLAIQTRFLTKRLEFHLLGNHLFANAKALVFAGLFFEGEEAEVWLEKGLRILASELPEQILSDGGHFERSPMYHSIILEDLLDLINLSQRYTSEIPDSRLRGNDIKELWNAMIEGGEAEAEKGNNELAETERAPMIGAAKRMLAWLKVMSHPDGQIALFNDAAFGIAPYPAELYAYAERLGIHESAESLAEEHPSASSFIDHFSFDSIRLTHLKHSGYIRVENGPMTAILDVAPVGPDYLPGHAHADTLSFELSFHGQRIIVDSGTSRYGAGTERLRQRSTAAHNSVIVNGKDSSEVWGSFRVARRARPFGLEIKETSDGSIMVSCAHDGYRRFPGKPVHRREWRFNDHSLTVRDVIEGRYSEAVSRFHLHPSITIENRDGAPFIFVLPDSKKISCQVKKGRAHQDSSTYHPECGVSIANCCLDIYFTEPETYVEFCW